MAQFNKNTHQYLSNGTSLFEAVMLADQYGNLIGAANPSGVAVDAFGRARMSTPLTLFDSSHRYKDNGLWSTANTGNVDVQFSSNEGLMNLVLTDGVANAEIIRETTKVMTYQPGKSLFILNTFVMQPAKENLRQRVGYFGANNGIFLQQSSNTVSFVERSSVTGSVIDTLVNQQDWNVDKMDGTGPSLMTLDLSKAQILWMDIEWLGLGTVRCGFVIDGKLIHCHSFHHANIISTTYITTASLPLRYEIKNIGTVSGGSTLKQICSSVVSEGGYELRGRQQAISTPITAPKTLATAGTYYPVISIRLKSTALDAVVILTALSMLGTGNGINFAWRVTAGATVTTVSWTSAGNDSAVEYTISGTATTGGRVLASGFFNSSNQASPTIDILKEALFKFQLERNGLTSTPEALTLEIASGTNTQGVFASMDWEEISR
jgi:hypothetical protein